MEKRHFEMIAAALKDAQAEHEDVYGASAWSPIENAANYIADGCFADNPRFDRKRFLKACGFTA